MRSWASVPSEGQGVGERLAGWRAAYPVQHQHQPVQHQHQVQKEQERCELYSHHAAFSQVHHADDRRQIDGERELEAQRRPAVGAGEVVAAERRQRGGDGREMRRHRRAGGGEKGHWVENLSTLLTWVFMSCSALAGSSSEPIRIFSSVGWTMRLICGALSVIGNSTVWRALM